MSTITTDATSWALDTLNEASSLAHCTPFVRAGRRGDKEGRWENRNGHFTYVVLEGDEAVAWYDLTTGRKTFSPLADGLTLAWLANAVHHSWE